MAGDGRFGQTRERGNDELRRRTTTATLQRQLNGLAFLLISSLLRTVYSDFLRSGILSVFFAIYRNFCSNCLEYKKWFTGRRFLSVESLYFPCQFDFLVQYLLVHGFVFLLPTAIILRVGLGFIVFC